MLRLRALLTHLRPLLLLLQPGEDSQKTATRMHSRHKQPSAAVLAVAAAVAMAKLLAEERAAQQLMMLVEESQHKRSRSNTAKTISSTCSRPRMP